MKKDTYAEEMEKFWKKCPAGDINSKPKEYWVKEIKHKQYTLPNYGNGIFGRMERVPAVLTIVCCYYDEEIKIVVDKNINKILEVYGINFNFSAEFLKKLEK